MKIGKEVLGDDLPIIWKSIWSLPLEKLFQKRSLWKLE